MGALKELSLSDLTSTEEPNTPDESSGDTLPDPSSAFLERKAQLRAEAAKRAKSRKSRRRKLADQRGEYRGNTTSGAWLPLMHGRGK